LLSGAPSASGFSSLDGRKGRRSTVSDRKSAVQTGAAVATMGLSLVAQGLWNRMTSGREVCRKAIEEAEAGLNEK